MIENTIPYKNVKSKACTKCGDIFPLTCEYWYHNKEHKDGFRSDCKVCCNKYLEDNQVRIKEHEAIYREKNKDKIAKKKAIYNQKNKEKIAKQRVEYRRKNKERIIKSRAKYYKENKKRISKKRDNYREDNKDKFYLYSLKHRISPVKFKVYESRLEIIDNIRRNGEYLEVACAYCGKFFMPRYTQVANRLRSINKTGKGECRFYCSEGCKVACPVYNQKKWPKGFKNNTSREVDPLVRQMCMERDSWTCQRCGAEGEDVILHAHHILSYAKNKIVSNDIENVITLCKKCHNEIHEMDGCKYHELKCD